MGAKAAVLLLGIAAFAVACTSGAVSSPTLDVPPTTTIVRVYYSDLATRNAIVIGFEHALMETNYAEGYHILKATDEDIQKLLAAGLRVEVDTTWTGPGSFSEIPPQDAASTPAPDP